MVDETDFIPTSFDSVHIGSLCLLSEDELNRDFATLPSRIDDHAFPSEFQAVVVACSISQSHVARRA
jgi:hypothetical protein